MEDIVFVKYWHPEFNSYCGRAYTYKTELPLKVGSKVIAPTRSDPRQRAIVTMTHLSPAVIDKKWEKDVKFITDMDTEV